MFEYFVFDSTVEQKQAVDVAMLAVMEAGILKNNPEIL